MNKRQQLIDEAIGHGYLISRDSKLCDAYYRACAGAGIPYIRLRPKIKYCTVFVDMDPLYPLRLSEQQVEQMMDAIADAAARNTRFWAGYGTASIHAGDILIDRADELGRELAAIWRSEWTGAEAKAVAYEAYRQWLRGL